MANSNTLTPSEQLAVGAQMNKKKKEPAGPENTGTRSDDGSYAYWRKKAVASRRMMLKKKMEDKAKDMVAMPVRKGTNNMLRSAWLNLIPSFGMTLIWIDIHAFLRIVFPTFFCKLGEEWLPQQVLKRTGDAGKNLGSGAFIGESMGLATLNFLAFIAIFLIFTIAAYAYSLIEKLGWFGELVT